MSSLEAMSPPFLRGLWESELLFGLRFRLSVLNCCPACEAELVKQTQAVIQGWADRLNEFEKWTRHFGMR